MGLDAGELYGPSQNAWIPAGGVSCRGGTPVIWNGEQKSQKLGKCAIAWGIGDGGDEFATNETARKLIRAAFCSLGGGASAKNCPLVLANLVITQRMWCGNDFSKSGRVVCGVHRL